MTQERPTPAVVSPKRFAIIGSELVAFTLLGVMIDVLAGWLPWATVTSTLLGLVAVMIQLVRAARP